MPTTESIATPPVAIMSYGRHEARRKIISEIPNQRHIHKGLDTPAQSGRFYVVASRAEGRFKGTFIGMLPIPVSATELPEAFAVTLPDPELN